MMLFEIRPNEWIEVRAQHFTEKGELKEEKHAWENKTQITRTVRIDTVIEPNGG